MEQYKLVLSDRERKLYEESSQKVATYLLASLAADPTNLNEFEIAFGRFGRGMDFSWFSDSETNGPSDRFLMIDLPSKTICGSPDISRIFPRGEACILLAKENTEFPIRYWLSSDWFLSDNPKTFTELTDERRKIFETQRRVDYRQVLYGRELAEFLVSNFEGDVSRCHARWLTTHRDDLDGKTPRQVLLEHQDRVDFDLYSRELQWSFGGSCPPLIPIDSDAFRYAGFGTHEFVIYYDLIRHLLDNFTDDVGELEEMKFKWFETPNSDGLSRLPLEVIEFERKRLPVEATAREMMIDEDCPICQMMMSEFDTPTFLHLDSAHFDEEYVFSNYKTEEEYLKNRKEWEEFNKRFEEESKSEKEKLLRDEIPY